MPEQTPVSIPVVSPQGEEGTVPLADLAAAKAAGFRDLSVDQAVDAAHQSAARGVLPAVTAGAAGLLRGGSLGLSDLALKAAAGDDADLAGQGLHQMREEYSGLSTGAELAGAVLPALATGGASAGAEAAGAVGLRGLGRAAAYATPSGLAGVAGTAAQRGLARIAGTSVLGRAIGTTARAAVEGFGIGAGQELSEEALGNLDLAADKILMGGLGGALLAGGVAGTGSLLASGAKRLLRGPSALVDGGKAGVAATTESKAAEDAAAQVEPVAAKKRLAGAIEDMRNEAAFRASGASKPLAEEAAKTVEGGTKGLGSRWFQEAPELVGEKSWSGMTREKLAQAAELGRKKYGAAIGEMIQKLDEKSGAASVGGGVKVADVLGDIATQREALLQRAGKAAEVRALDNFGDDVRRIAGMVDEKGAPIAGVGEPMLSFRQLKNLANDASSIAYKNAEGAGVPAGKLTGARAQMAAVRDVIEGRLISSADELVAGESAAFKDTYLEAKKGLQAFALLGKATDSSVAADATNRFFGLADRAGAIAGSMVGHAVGLGPIGSLAGAAAGTAIEKVVRAKGDFLAADALHRIAGLSAAERTIQSVDDRMSKAASAFFSGTAAVPKVAPRIAAAAAYRDRAADILRNAKDPAALVTKVDEATGKFKDFAPAVSSRMAATVQRAHQFMADRTPKPPARINMMQPQLEAKRLPSSLEITRYARYMAALDDPPSILEDMLSGRLSREGVEAVKAVHPPTFRKMQELMIDEAATSTRRLTYQQRLQLATLFEIPITPTANPSFVASCQQAMAATDESSPPARRSLRPATLATTKQVTDSLFTPAQRQEMGA